MVWSILKKFAGEVGPPDEQGLTLGERMSARLLDQLLAEPPPPDEDAGELRRRVDRLLLDLEADILGLQPTILAGRFARLWIDFLLRHDALPAEMHLHPDDLRIPREVIVAFHRGEKHIEPLARRMLNQIDRAFREGRLMLCELLLSLFETEAATRRNNERNIFFDRRTRQISAVRRVHLLSGTVARFRAHVATTLAESEGVLPVLEWLSDHAGVRFCAPLRLEPEVQRWDELPEPLRTRLDTAYSGRIPTGRYRHALVADEEWVRAELLRILSERGIRQQLATTVGAIYFVALSAGRCDFDDLLFDADAWVETWSTMRTATLLSEVHRRAHVDRLEVGKAIDDVIAEALRPDVEQDWVTPELISEALHSLHRRLRDIDLNALPAGTYDLSGVVGDTILAVPHRRLSRALRLHRLI